MNSCFLCRHSTLTHTIHRLEEPHEMKQAAILEISGLLFYTPPEAEPASDPGGGASLRPPEAEPASDPGGGASLRPRGRSRPQTPGGGASLRPRGRSQPQTPGGGAGLRPRGVRRRSLITTRQTAPGASAQELPTQRRSV
ncbi:unnamed protein product [Boreogadus saida]